MCSRGCMHCVIIQRGSLLKPLLTNKFAVWLFFHGFEPIGDRSAYSNTAPYHY